MKTLFSHLVTFSQTRGNSLPYHAEVPFEWELVINLDGTPRFRPLTPLPKRIVLVPRMNRTSAIRPMLASDGIAYVLGWPTPPLEGTTPSDARNLRNIQNASMRHAAFLALHRKWATATDPTHDPVPRALVNFLEQHADKIEQPESFTSTDGVLIRVGDLLAVEATSAVAFWSRHVRETKGTGREGVCLTCGCNALLTETLPQNIRSRHVPGAQSDLVPISINEEAFGYGLKKGLGQTPLCEECARAIPHALNTLLDSEDHRHKTPDSVHVWWLEGNYEGGLLSLDAPPDAATIKALAASPDTGLPTALQADLVEFHSLTMAGNSARLVVKEWLHRPVQEIQRNVARWFQDTQLPTGGDEDPQYAPLWRLAECTGRYDSNSKRYLRLSASGSSHPHGITDILRTAALTGTALPMTIAIHIIQRVSADQRVDGLRAALLRCYLVRSSYSKEGLMPGLDPNHPSAAYQLGRLLSVYSDVQYSSATVDGGQPPNSTFADKYLAGAITSPRLVLTAGAKQSSAWLAKLRRAQKSHFAQRSIDDIVSRLDSGDPLPVRASIDEQVLFVLGYQHQCAHDRRQRELAKQRRAGSDPSATD